MSNINICTQFVDQEPFWWWYQTIPIKKSLFGNMVYKTINFHEAHPDQNNVLLIYLLPLEDLTIKFLETQTKQFYDEILNKNYKILFLNQGYAIFHAHRYLKQWGTIFDHSYVDHNQFTYYRLINILKSKKINEEKLYFLHSADGYLAEIDELGKKKVKSINSTIQIKSKHIQLPLYLAWGHNTHVLVDSQIKYHYACLFSGRPAMHRQNLIRSLWQEKLLSKGKCSFRRVTGSPYFMEDIIYDKKITNTDDPNFSETDIFRDIFLWVAGETAIPQGYPFFTEKTIKAILYERPFISYGEPGILKYLRSFGFKTFGDYWDESYDDCENNEHKIEKITKIIKYICSKDIHELEKLLNDIRPILEHNKKLLKETDWANRLIYFFNN